MEKPRPEKKTPWLKVLGIGGAGSLIVGLITLALLWPAKVAEPHNYPIAITGNNAQQITAIKQAATQNNSDTVKFVDVASREEAVDMMNERKVFGALVVNMPNPEVLTASANGQAVNSVMTVMATNLQAKMNEMTAAHSMPNGAPTPKLQVKTTDVVPAHNPKFDIAQLALPLVFSGIIGGTVAARFIHGRWQRLSVLVMYSMLASGTLYLIVQTWFNLLPDSFLAITSAFSLGIFATASFVTSLYSLFGMRGLAAAGATTMLLANPLSGLIVPSIFLPELWGVIGQTLTVGATGTLVRAAAYFPAAEVATMPIIVLTIWSVVGVVVLSLRK